MAIEEDRSFSIDEGLQLGDNLGDIIGPFITGTPASPVGLSLSQNTFYIQNDGTGIKLWEKFGAGVNDWRQLTSADVFSHRKVVGGDVLEIPAEQQMVLSGLICIEEDGELCLPIRGQLALLG